MNFEASVAKLQYVADSKHSVYVTFAILLVLLSLMVAWLLHDEWRRFLADRDTHGPTVVIILLMFFLCCGMAALVFGGNSVVFIASPITLYLLLARLLKRPKSKKQKSGFTVLFSRDAALPVKLPSWTRQIGLAAKRDSRERRKLLNAEFLLYLLLGQREADWIAGDLQERLPKMRRKFGLRRARLWYWSQVIRSIGPLGLKALKRLSGIGFLVEMWVRARGGH